MADFGALSKLTKRADAVSESASVLVSRAIRDIRGEISNLSDELNLAGSADARDKAYTMIRNRMNRLGTQLNRLLVAQQQMSAKAAAKSASDMTGVEIKYSAKRAQAIFEMVSPAQGENLAAVFTDKMGANLINSLREATVTALREQAVAGGSMKDTAKAMRDKWFDAVKDGVPKFVDSSGKEWNTQTYFQMNVRTNSMRVYNDCLIDDVARETGSDVMRISTGGDPNCECAAWEGTLVSLTGKTKGLPTYDDAKAGGCFHPNCVHTLEYVDEYADADEIKRAQDHPYQDPGPDGDIWQVQDDRKYEIDQAVKMDEQGMTQEEARVAVDRDNLAASIRAGLIRSDADDLVAKMTDAQVTALCKDGNPPEFQPFKPTKKELADGAVQKWNHGKWGGVVHVDAGASAEDILKVCKIGDNPEPPQKVVEPKKKEQAKVENVPVEELKKLEVSEAIKKADYLIKNADEIKAFGSVVEELQKIGEEAKKAKVAEYEKVRNEAMKLYMDGNISYKEYKARTKKSWDAIWDEKAITTDKICKRSRELFDNGERSSVVEGKVSSARKDRFEQAKDILQTIVSPDVMPKEACTVKAVSGRAYQALSAIHLSGSDDVSVYVHEFMHFIEEYNPHVHKRCVDFLLYRTAGESYHSLRSLTGNKGYRYDECAIKDKFFSPYCGKLYRRLTRPGGEYEYRATEILSMGAEKMVKDPGEFLQKDPEYFGFVYNLLRGNI